MRAFKTIMGLALLSILFARLTLHGGALAQGGATCLEVPNAGGLGGKLEACSWTKLCFEVPRAKERVGISEKLEACFTHAWLRDPPTSITMAAFGVLQAAEKNVFVALLPLPSALPHEPGFIRLDDGTQIKLAYLAHGACDIRGCYGRAEISETLLERMKSVEGISFGSPFVPGRETSIALPGRGFRTALDGAALPEQAQDEPQRSIREIVRQRFPDFIW
jgi:invasion protein IalB